MRLGLNLGYWGAGNDADNLVLAKEADRLPKDAVTQLSSPKLKDALEFAMQAIGVSQPFQVGSRRTDLR